MRCSDVEEMLSTYADGEIGDLEAAEVRAHLSECHSCASRLDGLEALQSQLVEMMDSMPKAIDVSDLVMSSLPKWGAPVARRWMWALAGVALTAVLAWQVVQRTGPANPKRPNVPRMASSSGSVKRDHTTTIVVTQPESLPVDQRTRTRKESAPRQRPIQTAARPRRVLRTAGLKPSPGASKRFVPDVAPPEPIRIAVSSRTVDQGVEETLEVTAGAVMVFRARTTEVNIARDDSSAAISRPPLEVVKNGPPAIAALDGG